MCNKTHNNLLHDVAQIEKFNALSQKKNLKFGTSVPYNI